MTSVFSWFRSPQWRWLCQTLASRAAPALGDTGCHNNQSARKSARPPFFCRGCRGSSVPMFFSGASMLKVVDTMLSAARFVWKSSCVCWVVQPAVQQYAIVPQLLPGRPSTDSYHIELLSRRVRAVAAGPSGGHPPRVGTRVLCMSCRDPRVCPDTAPTLVAVVLVLRSRGRVVRSGECSVEVDIMCIHQRDLNMLSCSLW